MDPNASGRVQAVHGGRIEPGPKGLPVAGQVMIVRGSLGRLTPVLMTALVAAFALTPVLFRLFGEYALRRPVGEKVHTPDPVAGMQEAY